jgi:hypothetical protein
VSIKLSDLSVPNPQPLGICASALPQKICRRLIDVSASVHAGFKQVRGKL